MLWFLMGVAMASNVEVVPEWCAEGETVEVTWNMDGSPLSADELAWIQWTADEGLPDAVQDEVAAWNRLSQELQCVCPDATTEDARWTVSILAEDYEGTQDGQSGEVWVRCGEQAEAADKSSDDKSSDDGCSTVTGTGGLAWVGLVLWARRRSPDGGMGGA